MPPSDVPRRVLTATGTPPAACAWWWCFLLLHGISVISDGIVINVWWWFGRGGRPATVDPVADRDVEVVGDTRWCGPALICMLMSTTGMDGWMDGRAAGSQLPFKPRRRVAGGRRVCARRGTRGVLVRGQATAPDGSRRRTHASTALSPYPYVCSSGTRRVCLHVHR